MQKSKKSSNSPTSSPSLDSLSGDREKDQPIGEIDSYLGYWLRFVSNQVTTSFQQRLAQKGITVAEWIALRFLKSHSPCSLTELSDSMGMNKGALSRLTDRLEKRGLIKRTITAKDRRLFSIELTPAGRKLVPILAKIAQENDDHFFKDLSKTEFETILNFLKRIVILHGFRGKPID